MAGEGEVWYPSLVEYVLERHVLHQIEAYWHRLGSFHMNSGPFQFSSRLMPWDPGSSQDDVCGGSLQKSEHAVFGLTLRDIVGG